MEEERDHREGPTRQPYFPPAPPKVTHPMDKGMSVSPRSRYKYDAPKREHCICIIIFLLLLGIIALIVWLAYRPSKPRFTVASAAVYGLNTTVPPLISITMQFNILVNNPNRRVSIYVDSFSTFVSYRSQPITPHVVLPPLFLEKHSTVSLSPVVGGAPVAVSVDVANGLAVDEAYGVVGMKLVFHGRLRWKAGDITSAHYGMYVKCDLLMALKKGFLGQIPLIGTPLCDVDL